MFADDRPCPGRARGRVRLQGDKPTRHRVHLRRNTRRECVLHVPLAYLFASCVSEVRLQHIQAPDFHSFLRSAPDLPKFFPGFSKFVVTLSQVENLRIPQIFLRFS